MRLPFSTALLAVACALPGFGQTATATATGQDVSVGSPLALTFYVSLTNPTGAEAMAQAIQTPGSSSYHHFLTLGEFVKDYAVSDAELQEVEGSLENLGFTIGYVYPNHLAIEVTTTAGTADAVLGVHLKQFVKNGVTGFAPTQPLSLPAQLQGKISGVGGLNSMALARPMHMKASLPGLTASALSTTHPVAGTLVGGTPENYLPADYAKFYDVNPLYDRDYKGRGATIGIVTLANFDTSDDYTFWKEIGLNVSQTRITKVDVDGGTTAPGDLDGEGETDIDTEYSGALAPDADLRVYVAPNQTNANFINGFEAAASDNIADTVSTSWGQPELDYFPEVDPAYPSTTYQLDEFHAVFLEMALQGQTIYVAAGDSGSFDTVRDICGAFGTPSPTNPVCNAPYAVDSPANDPLVTAAGGTTLPFTAMIGPLHVTVPTQRAWAWDYFVTQAADQGLASEFPLSEFFSVGGGGGVSSYFALPWYQKSTPGITKTMPGQYLSFDYGSGSVVDVVLPSEFAGRNMPDISTDADPYTGYQYIQAGAVVNGYGGTSFVAPQLNGVTALFVQALGGRVGQISPALYQLNYDSTKDVTAGDNWGYAALPKYDNASGLGTLDALDLLTGLQKLKAQ